jgi:DNA repair protein RadC
MINLNKISDTDIKKEYYKRFTLQHNTVIRSSEMVASHARAFFQDMPDREQFLMILLNGRNAVLDTKVLFTGTLTSSAVYPREVIKLALSQKTAAVIFAHNHPSEYAQPSKDDINITKRLQESCKTIEVIVHDHVIVAGSKYFSFGDEGLL